jgi:uncharacterized protein YdhG (YjbR/CyaY superfamily)
MGREASGAGGGRQIGESCWAKIAAGQRYKDKVQLARHDWHVAMRGRQGLTEAIGLGIVANMKKAKSADRRPVAKSKVTPRTVDEYLAGVPERARTTLNKIRATIRSVVPKETTETISYGVPTFRYKVPVIWFAAFSNHCSVFPTAAVIEQFKDELKNYRTSKGTIQFPVDQPLPAALLKKMVKARLAEIENKKER